MELAVELAVELAAKVIESQNYREPTEPHQLNRTN
jgi:hypothetical protein